MQDINNLNLDPIDEKENSVDDQLNKEMEITPDKLEYSFPVGFSDV